MYVLGPVQLLLDQVSGPKNKQRSTGLAEPPLPDYEQRQGFSGLVIQRLTASGSRLGSNPVRQDSTLGRTRLARRSSAYPLSWVRRLHQPVLQAPRKTRTASGAMAHQRSMKPHGHGRT